MATTEMPAPVLKPGALYLGDNGRCFCWRHGGRTATYSGCDLSGQPVERLTAADVREAQAMGWTPACEWCGVTQEQA
jgi:hypothetical protein